MLKIAFASNDRTRVNQHFGAAEGFVLYEVSPTRTSMVGVAEFAPEAMDGNENKLGAKVDFLEGCAAVFVMAIGASAIKQLVARGIRPIRITESDKIEDLLYDIAQGMKHGGGRPRFGPKSVTNSRLPSRRIKISRAALSLVDFSVGLVRQFAGCGPGD